MFAGTVRQLCQPPVLAIAKLPIGALPRLSRRTSTSPLSPPAAPDAARATNWRPGFDPKSTPSNRSQSPFPIHPTSWPPPVSAHASSWVPDWASELSAWMVPYASRGPPVGGGLVGGGLVGGGFVVPPPPLVYTET